MLVTYGHGQYVMKTTRIEGQVLLGEHKLFLSGPQGEDLAQTYIPLEKICRIRMGFKSIEFVVRISILEQYLVQLRVDKKARTELVQELARRRGLKKQFLRREWFDPTC